MSDTAFHGGSRGIRSRPSIRPHKSDHKGDPMEKLYRNGLTPEEAERRWFAGLLWKAFPEAHSEEELSGLVAEVLTTDRRPVHPKTVRNWLRCDNTPHFRYVMRVLAMAGAESLFQIIDRESAA